MSAGKAGNKRSGGRRRNYAARDETPSLRSRLPTGWANWLGFALFGVCSIGVLSWSVVYVGRGDWADAAVAGCLGLALVYMVYLFGTTRLRV